jgi:hypothetical protein
MTFCDKLTYGEACATFPFVIIAVLRMKKGWQTHRMLRFTLLATEPARGEMPTAWISTGMALTFRHDLSFAMVRRRSLLDGSPLCPMQHKPLTTQAYHEATETSERDTPERMSGPRCEEKGDESSCDAAEQEHSQRRSAAKPKRHRSVGRSGH